MASAARFHPLRLLSGTDPVLSLCRLSAEAGRRAGSLAGTVGSPSRAAPGRPLCAAMVEGKPVVNLPGPFIAAYHGFEWCIGALVSYCLYQPRPERRTLEATLDDGLPGSDKISLLCSLDVRLGSDGGYVAHPIDFRQSSSARTAAANAQYMTSLGGPPPRAGDRIVVELLREPGSIGC